MTQRFVKGSGLYKCQNCGKMTRETGEGESYVELCRHCWDEAGWENFISDGGNINEIPDEFRYLLTKQEK